MYNDPNDQDLKYGIGCADATVKWFPESQGDVPEGMFILKSLPEKQILPENLVKDSRALLDQVVKNITYNGAFNRSLIQKISHLV